MYGLKRLISDLLDLLDSPILSKNQKLVITNAIQVIDCIVPIRTVFLVSRNEEKYMSLTPDEHSRYVEARLRIQLADYLKKECFVEYAQCIEPTVIRNEARIWVLKNKTAEVEDLS